MLVKKDVLNSLKDLGLNSYEAKLWIALLSRGIATAGELSDIAGVPRSRSYDVLESLEKKGFIIIKLGKPIRYIAVQPDEVISRVKKQIELETKESLASLEKIHNSELMEELKKLHSNCLNFIDPNELSGVIRGRTNIEDQLERMAGRAKRSINIMSTDENLALEAKALERAFSKNNGVRARILINEKATKAARGLERIAEFKACEKPSGNFAVVDGKEVLCMLSGSDHPDFESAIWLNAPALAGVLDAFFENVWKTRK